MLISRNIIHIKNIPGYLKKTHILKLHPPCSQNIFLLPVYCIFKQNTLNNQICVQVNYRRKSFKISTKKYIILLVAYGQQNEVVKKSFISYDPHHQMKQNLKVNTHYLSITQSTLCIICSYVLSSQSFRLQNLLNGYNHSLRRNWVYLTLNLGRIQSNSLDVK